MNVIKVTALCVISAIICTMLRKERPEMTVALSIATGFAVLFLLSDDLRRSIESIVLVAQRTGLEKNSVSLLLKTAGIALLAEFAAQLCEDAGEKNMGTRILLASRIGMLAMAIPTLSQLLELLMEAQT